MNIVKVLLLMVILAALAVSAVYFNPFLLGFFLIFLWVVFVSVKGDLTKTGVIGLILYMPFDLIVCGHMPGRLFLYAKYFSTAFVLFLSVLVIINNSGRLFLLKRIPGLPALFLYMFAAGISAVINKTNPIVTLTAIQQELRYIPMFIALSLAAFDEEFIKKCINWMLFAALVTIVIGFAQLGAGKLINRFLILKPVSMNGDLLFEGTMQFVQETGLIFSVFSSYNVFGIYLSIILILILGLNVFKVYPGGLKQKLVFIFGWIALVFTLSRQAIMGTIAGYVYVMFAGRSRKAIILSTAVLLFVMVFSILGYEANIFSYDAQKLPFAQRLLEAFSPQAWQTASESGRVRLIVLTVKAVVDNNSFLFGLGPGNWGSLMAWKNSDIYRSALFSETGSLLKGVLADVNWTSIFGQFGAVGLIFFCMILFSILRFSFRHILDPDATALSKGLALTSAGLIAAVSAESFFGPWFASRITSFHLWTIMGFFMSVVNNEYLKSVYSTKEG